MSGLGGIGSGRYGVRATVEGCRTLDVNRLRREGCLVPGWRGLWAWSCEGERTGSVNLVAGDRTLSLSYRCRSHGGDWVDVAYAVPIAWTPCNFGGARPWFVCPGVVNGVRCGRRVAKLYNAGRYFLCRNCGDLAYESQSERPHERRLRRANGIRLRLGGEPDMAAPFPDRPKGMHRRTYETLRQRVDDAAAQADDYLSIQLVRVAARWDKRLRKGFWT